MGTSTYYFDKTVYMLNVGIQLLHNCCCGSHVGPYAKKATSPSKSSRSVLGTQKGGCGSWLAGSPKSLQYVVSRERSSSLTGCSSWVMQSGRPRAQATISGVWPRRLRRLGDAPEMTSRRVIDGRSAATARCRAVWPCWWSRMSSRCDAPQLWANAVR